MSEEKERKYTQEEVLKIQQDRFLENQRIDSLAEENKRNLIQIQHAKLQMQKREMDRLKTIQERIDGEDILNRSFSTEDMLKSVEDRKKSITFLNERVSLDFVIAPGSLVAIPSMTNNGKSTLVAHICEALVNENKTVLVLSNEETEEDVRARISCLRKSISFGDYKSNKCTPEQIDIVLKDAHFLGATKRLIVISSKNEIDAYRVTTVDGVISTLKSVNNKIDACVIDYYNNINVSEMGTVDPWHVNNRFATEMNTLKGTLSYPTIIMAQCQGIKADKKLDRKSQLDFDANHPMYRWKGGQNLLVYATDIIELTRDFENSCSVLFAHKVRFAHGQMERLHELPFDKKMQRFVKWTPEWDAKMTADKVRRQSQKNIDEVNLKDIFKDGV